MALTETEQRQAFIERLERVAIGEANSKSMKIRIERDSRGRFPSLTIRAVAQHNKGDSLLVESWIIDGVKQK